MFPSVDLVNQLRQAQLANLPCFVKIIETTQAKRLDPFTGTQPHVLNLYNQPGFVHNEMHDFHILRLAKPNLPFITGTPSILTVPSTKAMVSRSLTKHSPEGMRGKPVLI